MPPPVQRCRRVGHSFIKSASLPGEIGPRAASSTWDMVEIDVLVLDGELVVAHDRDDLALPAVLRLAPALEELARHLPPHVELNVDLKWHGYEARVVEALREHGLIERALVSTMEKRSLPVIRALEPALRLGWSVPRVRRDYTQSALLKYPAYGVIAYGRQVLPGRAAAKLRANEIDALMAHWLFVTPRLVRAVKDAGGDLYVWTVDDARRIEHLERLGVTGIISNDSRLFAAS